MHLQEGHSKSNASYFIVLSYNFWRYCWWHDIIIYIYIYICTHVYICIYLCLLCIYIYIIIIMIKSCWQYRVPWLSDSQSIPIIHYSCYISSCYIFTDAMIKTQEDFFINICTSHFIARVGKGLLKVCVWEGDICKHTSLFIAYIFTHSKINIYIKTT